MNMHSMERYSLLFMEYRLEKRLPIQTIEDIDYVKDRFYWVVDKFIDQYLVDGVNINIKQYFTQVFKFIMDGIDNLDLSKIHDFKRGMACSMIAVADFMGCKLKVTQDFFIDQFLRVVDQRFSRQRDIIQAELDHLSHVLMHAGANRENVYKIIEAGMTTAETVRNYEYNLSEYITKVIDGIVKECSRLKLALTHETLISHTVKLMMKKPAWSDHITDPDMIIYVTKEHLEGGQINV